MTPVIRLFRASSSRTSHHTKSWDTFARYRPSFLCTPFLSALLIVPVPLQPGQQVPLVSSALSSLGPHRNLSRSHEPEAAEKQVLTAEGAPAVRKYLVQGRRHGGQRGQNSAAAGVPTAAWFEILHQQDFPAFSWSSARSQTSSKAAAPAQRLNENQEL